MIKHIEVEEICIKQVVNNPIYINPYSVKLTIVLHPFFSAIIPAGN